MIRKAKPTQSLLKFCHSKDVGIDTGGGNSYMCGHEKMHAQFDPAPSVLHICLRETHADVHKHTQVIFCSAAYHGEIKNSPQ